MISDYVVVDLEMTGLSAKTDQVIEIGAIKIRDGQMVDKMQCMVNPQCKIPSHVTELTGITDAMVQDGMARDEAMQGLLDFIEGEYLVGQNIGFDYSFMKQWAINHKVPLEVKACDTLKLARTLLPGEQPKNLAALCAYFGIARQREHRALDDAIETWQVFECLKDMAAGNATLAPIFEPKQLFYKAKKQTPATAHQLQRLKEYRQRMHLEDEINWDNLTRSEASRIMDRYIATYGRINPSAQQDE